MSLHAVRRHAACAVIFAIAALGRPLDARRVSGQAGDHPPLEGGGASECLTCHPGMTEHRVVHGPVAEGACLRCHELTTVGGRVTMRLAAGATPQRPAPLCLSCHTDLAARMAEPHVHAPVESGACGACHDPHGSNATYQLKAEGNAVCLRCHEDIRGALGSRTVHPPAAAACVLCHDPHASPFAVQTRLPLNALCLSCHFSAAAPADDSDPLDFPRHRLAALERRLFERAPRIGLEPDGTRGHPVVKHPVANRLDPKTGGSFGCPSCHNPHGSRGPRLFRFDALTLVELCRNCHLF